MRTYFLTLLFLGCLAPPYCIVEKNEEVLFERFSPLMENACEEIYYLSRFYFEKIVELPSSMELDLEDMKQEGSAHLWELVTHSKSRNIRSKTILRSLQNFLTSFIAQRYQIQKDEIPHYQIAIETLQKIIQGYPVEEKAYRDEVNREQILSELKMKFIQRFKENRGWIDPARLEPLFAVLANVVETTRFEVKFSIAPPTHDWWRQEITKRLQQTTEWNDLANDLSQDVRDALIQFFNDVLKKFSIRNKLVIASTDGLDFFLFRYRFGSEVQKNPVYKNLINSTHMEIEVLMRSIARQILSIIISGRGEPQSEITPDEILRRGIREILLERETTMRLTFGVDNTLSNVLYYMPWELRTTLTTMIKQKMLALLSTNEGFSEESIYNEIIQSFKTTPAYQKSGYSFDFFIESLVPKLYNSLPKHGRIEESDLNELKIASQRILQNQSIEISKQTITRDFVDARFAASLDVLAILDSILVLKTRLDTFPYAHHQQPLSQAIMNLFQETSFYQQRVLLPENLPKALVVSSGKSEEILYHRERPEKREPLGISQKKEEALRKWIAERTTAKERKILPFFLRGKLSEREKKDYRELLKKFRQWILLGYLEPFGALEYVVDVLEKTDILMEGSDVLSQQL